MMLLNNIHPSIYFIFGFATYFIYTRYQSFNNHTCNHAPLIKKPIPE